jgi:hypothetical protein
MSSKSSRGSHAHPSTATSSTAAEGRGAPGPSPQFQILEDAHALLTCTTGNGAASPVLLRVLELWRNQIGASAVWRLLIVSGSCSFAEEECLPDGPSGPGGRAGSGETARFDHWLQFVGQRIALSHRDAYLFATLIKMSTVLATVAPDRLNSLLVPATPAASGSTQQPPRSLTPATIGTLQCIFVVGLRRLSRAALLSALPPPALLFPWYRSSGEGGDGLLMREAHAVKDGALQRRGVIRCVCWRAVGQGPAGGASRMSDAAAMVVPQLLVASTRNVPRDSTLPSLEQEVASQASRRTSECLRLFLSSPNGKERGPSTRSAAQQQRLLERFKSSAAKAALGRGDDNTVEIVDVDNGETSVSANVNQANKLSTEPIEAQHAFVLPAGAAACAATGLEDGHSQLIGVGAQGAITPVAVARTLLLTARRVVPMAHDDVGGVATAVAAALGQLAVLTLCAVGGQAATKGDVDNVGLAAAALSLQCWLRDAAVQPAKSALQMDSLVRAAFAIVLPRSIHRRSAANEAEPRCVLLLAAAVKYASPELRGALGDVLCNTGNFKGYLTDSLLRLAFPQDLPTRPVPAKSAQPAIQQQKLSLRPGKRDHLVTPSHSSGEPAVKILRKELMRDDDVVQLSTADAALRLWNWLETAGSDTVGRS